MAMEKNKPLRNYGVVDHVVVRTTVLMAQFVANGAIDAFVDLAKSSEICNDPEMAFLTPLLRGLPTWLRFMTDHLGISHIYQDHMNLAKETMKDVEWQQKVAERKARISKGIPIGDAPYDFSLEWTGCCLSFTVMPESGVADRHMQDVDIIADAETCVPGMNRFAAINADNMFSTAFNVVRPINKTYPPGIYYFPDRNGTKRWSYMGPLHIVPWIRKARPSKDPVTKEKLPVSVQNWRAYHRRKYFKSLQTVNHYIDVIAPDGNVMKVHQDEKPKFHRKQPWLRKQQSGMKDEKTNIFYLETFEAKKRVLALIRLAGVKEDLARSMLSGCGGDLVDALYAHNLSQGVNMDRAEVARIVEQYNQE